MYIYDLRRISHNFLRSDTPHVLNPPHPKPPTQSHSPTLSTNPLHQPSPHPNLSKPYGATPLTPSQTPSTTLTTSSSNPPFPTPSTFRPNCPTRLAPSTTPSPVPKRRMEHHPPQRHLRQRPAQRLDVRPRRAWPACRTRRCARRPSGSPVRSAFRPCGLRWRRRLGNRRRGGWRGGGGD